MDNEQEEQLNGVYKFEQDDKSTIEVLFDNGKQRHVIISKDDKIKSMFIFNENGELHGDIIMDNKKYLFENGSIKL